MGGVTVADLVARLTGDVMPFLAEMDKAKASGEDFAKKNEGWISGFMKVGAAAGVGMALVTAASVKMAVDFQTQYTRLYTAAGASKDEVLANRDAMLALGNASGFTGTQIAEALYHPVSAGLTLAASIEAVRYASEEARISGASLDDTTYSLSSVMKAYNLNAGDAKQTMAELNAIVGQGDMHFQDFNVSVKNWAPTASQMGLSITSVGSAIAYLTDRGNSAEEASTRLTMGLTMMAYPSKKAADLLVGLGVASKDVTGSSDAMTAVLRKAGVTQNQLAADLQKPDGIYVALSHVKQALQDAGVKGTEADAAISKIFGGGRSDKAILSLMQNLDGLKTKFDDVTKSSDPKVFEKAWQDAQGTLAVQFDKIKASVENLGIKFGTWLIPKISEFIVFAGRTAGPVVQKLATDIKNVFDSPAMHQAEAVLRETFRNLVSFTKDAATAVDNLWHALQPTVSLLAVGFFGALKSVGEVLKNDIGPTVVAVSKFFREHAAVIKDLSEVVLTALIAKLVYTKTLLMFDMFTKFIGGIGAAVTAYKGFVTAVSTGAIFDTIRFKGMLAAEAVGNLGNATQVAGAKAVVAAEENAGAKGFGGFVKGLGNSLPIIGAVALAGYGLYKVFGHMGVAANDTTQQITGLTNAMLDMSNGLDTSDGRMRDMILTAQHFGGSIEKQLVEPIDRSLAALVSSGHIQQAKDAIAGLDNQVTAAGGSADRFNNQLSQYTDAAKQYALQQRMSTTATSDNASAMDVNASSASNLAAAVAGANQAQQELTAGINASRALDDFQTQIDNVSKALQDNGTVMDGNSASARNNRDAIRGAVQSMLNNYDAQIQVTGPTQAATDKFKAQVDQLIQNSSQSEDTRKKVRAFIDTLNAIPKDIPPIKITVDTYGGLQKIDELNNRIINLGGTLATAMQVGKTPVKAYAEGGTVPGPKGAPQLAIVHGGEVIVSNDDQARMSIFSGPAPMSPFGGGTSGGTTIINNTYVTNQIAGSVLAEQDLRTLMETQMLQLGGRRSRTYDPYKR
jgi:TP901 family phage tail tape measure protein